LYNSGVPLTTRSVLITSGRQLQAGGHKVVHMVPREPLTTLPKYDEMVRQMDKLSVNDTRPLSSVVHTIAQ
jgi:hypothetical protein